MDPFMASFGIRYRDYLLFYSSLVLVQPNDSSYFEEDEVTFDEVQPVPVQEESPLVPTAKSESPPSVATSIDQNILDHQNRPHARQKETNSFLCAPQRNRKTVPVLETRGKRKAACPVTITILDVK